MALDRLTKVDGGGISTTSDYRVGIITATKFVGPIEGDVTGSITATDGTFSGNVSIAGTLTYEDVTNIDSVGIITARGGIDCNGDIDVDGHTNLDNVSIAGVTTIATNTTIGGNLTVNGTNTILNTTTYVKGGEGAAGILAIYADEGDDVADMWRLKSDTDGTFKLDNYAGSAWETNIKSVGNGAVELYHNNLRKIFTTATGAQISCGADGDGLTLEGTTNRIDLVANTNRSGATNTILELDAHWNNTSVAFMAFATGDDTTNKDDGIIRFFTKPSGGTISERLRIDSSGRVLIGSTAKAGDSALQVYTSDQLHPAIRTNAGNSNGYTMFGDAYKADESQVNFGIAYSSASLVISQGCKVSTSSDDAYVSSQDSYNTRPNVLRLDTDGSFSFHTTESASTTPTDNAVSPIERFRISSDGKVGINQVPTRELSLHSPDNNNALIHFTNDDTGETSSDGILVGLNGNEDMIINNQESGKNIIVYTHNGSSIGERLRITSDGDVAIGRDTALNNYAAGSTTTQLAVVKDGGAAGSGYHEVAHFTGGTDTDDTGAIVRITQFNNDRGLYIKGGRGTGNQAKAIFGLRNSSNSESDVMTFLEGGNISIGGNFTAGRKVHIKDSGQIRLENTSTGSWAGLEFLCSSGTNDYDAYMGVQDSDGLFFIDNNSNGIDFAINQAGQVQVLQTTQSTTTTSGALKVSGGIGVAKNIICGGALEVQNNTLTVTSGAPNIVMAVPSGGLDSRIYNDGSGNFIIGHGTNSSTPTERLRINSAGSLLTPNGSPLMSKGSNSQQNGGHEVYNDQHLIEINDSNNSFHVMRQWTATKFGEFRVEFEAMIQSGSYYFSYDIYNSTRGERISASGTGNDTANGVNVSRWVDHLDSGFGSSVHAMRRFTVRCGQNYPVQPGDTIQLRMASTAGNGNLVTGNGQTLKCEHLQIFNDTPDLETGGRGFQPSPVAFHVVMMGQNQSFSGDLSWNNGYTAFNRGYRRSNVSGNPVNAGFDIANSRFIVPYTGIYAFYFNGFVNTASDCRMAVTINGSAYQSGYIWGCNSNEGQATPNQAGFISLYLGAGANIKLKIVSGTLSNTYGGHTSWGGWLIG